MNSFINQQPADLVPNFVPCRGYFNKSLFS